MEFLVITYDKTDDEALSRRLVVRDEHIAAARRTIESGNMLIGGAICDDSSRMIGSMTVVSFPTREAFDAWLKAVPYMRHGIWDQVEVLPYQLAVMRGGLPPSAVR